MPNDLFEKFIECQTPYALLFIPKKNTGTRAYVFSGHEKIQPESFLSDNPELISFGYLSFEGEAFFYRSINNHFLEEDADHTRFEINNKLKNLSAHSPVIIKKEDLENFSTWSQMIQKAKDKFGQFSELKKIVLHRKINLELQDPINTHHLLHFLPEVSEDHYFFIFKNHDQYIISYSPETLCHYKEDKFNTISLAGTFPRNLESREIDLKNSEELLRDPKNLREQHLVTERIKKDLSLYSSDIEIGPIYILKQKFVQHLAQNICATISKSLIGTLIKKLHPTPALGGEPRQLALETISEIEQSPRQSYGGAFGHNFNQEIHLAVNIRCMVFHLQQRKITLYGGCGILEESDPKLEWEETENKMRHFLLHFKKFQQKSTKEH